MHGYATSVLQTGRVIGRNKHLMWGLSEKISVEKGNLGCFARYVGFISREEQMKVISREEMDWGYWVWLRFGPKQVYCFNKTENITHSRSQSLQIKWIVHLKRGIHFLTKKRTEIWVGNCGHFNLMKGVYCLGTPSKGTEFLENCLWF